MCKVFIGEAEKKLGFILYNHLYAREQKDFTTKDLMQELGKYNLDFTQKELQEEIDNLVSNGSVTYSVGHYTCLL